MNDGRIVPVQIHQPLKYLPSPAFEGILVQLSVLHSIPAHMLVSNEECECNFACAEHSLRSRLHSAIHIRQTGSQALGPNQHAAGAALRQRNS